MVNPLSLDTTYCLVFVSIYLITVLTVFDNLHSYSFSIISDSGVFAAHR